MLCAHAIRRCKPGSFYQFVETFSPPAGADPGGWVRFHVLRSLADENEVITFEFDDGSLAELESSQDEQGYEEMKAAVAPLVEDVISNGVYEISVSRTVDGAAA
jgi:hypothetical protein